MVLGLRATTVDSTGTFGPSGCRFSCVHKEVCIREEIVGVLLQVSIVGTLVHECGIHTLPERCCLLLLGLL